MNKRLNGIRVKAIEIREKLSYANPDEQKKIAKLDKIIRGTVLVKWMHLFACIAFIVIAAVFMYLVYPDAKAMALILSFALGGYLICLFGVLIQMKMFDHAIGKVRSALETQRAA